MSRRFAIGANPMTADEKAAIRRWLGEDCAWWNWINGLWLIRSNKGFHTTETIREKFRELAPDADIIVIQIPHGDTWSGYGPSDEQRNMFRWIKNTWDQD